MCNYRREPLARGRCTLSRRAVAITVLGVMACGDPAAPVAPPAAPSTSAPTLTGQSATGAYNNFYNVQVQPEGWAVNFYFQYIGNGSPIVSLGQTADIYNSLITWVPAKNMNNGYWYARINGIAPATQYYYRLDDLQSTWSGSFKTYRRRLTIDVNKIHVTYDGDELGCGEMIFRGNVSPYPSWQIGNRFWQSTWHDLCSGGDLYLSDAEGRYVVDDWTPSSFGLWFKVLESDSCFAWESFCGDIAWATQELFFDTTNWAKSYTFQISTPQSSKKPVVTWEGTVKTTFVP